MLRRKTVHSVLTLIALLALTAPPSGAENPVACTITARSEESIQAAIDRAPEHAVICLPEGEWHENLTITKSLILQGSGPGLSVIMARDEDKPVISISSSGEGAAVDVMIESITVAGASLRFGWGIKIEDSTEAAIVGCSIRDNSGGISLLESCQALITGCTIEGNDGDGICVEDSAWATVSDCTIERNEFAIYMEGSTNASVVDCTLDGNRRFGIDLRDSSQASISGCTIGESWYGISMFDSSEATITACVIEGNEERGIELEGSARAVISGCNINANGIGISVQDSGGPTIAGNTICNNEYGIFSRSDGPIEGSNNHMRENGVDLVGNMSAKLREPLVSERGEAQLSFPGPYSSLQETLDALAPGGAITLTSGTYEGGLTVWKPMSIIGVSSDVVIEGTVSLIDEAQEVAISGVNMRRAEWGLLAAGHSQATITACTFEQADIEIRDFAQVSLSDCAIRLNWNGIAVYDSACATIADCIIEKNQNHGINIAGTTRVAVSGCTIEENVNGINIGASPEVTIESNEILSNRRYGIACGGDPCAVVLWPFTGYVEGNGNSIPGPGEDGGNTRGDVCPDELAFLVTQEGGELDRRD